MAWRRSRGRGHRDPGSVHSAAPVHGAVGSPKGPVACHRYVLARTDWDAPRVAGERFRVYLNHRGLPGA